MKNRVFTIIGGASGVGKTSFTGALKNIVGGLGIIVDAYKIAKQLNCNNAIAEKIALNRMNDYIHLK